MAQQNSESNKLEKLIEALGKSSPEDDLELTGEEIADVLWFSLKLQEFGFKSKNENEEEKVNQGEEENKAKESKTPLEPPQVPP